MVVLGLLLLVAGYVLDVYALWVIGVVLIVIGAVLWLLARAGRPVMGRRHWY